MNSEKLELHATVGLNVRAERARRNWTQDQLADELRWSRSMVSETERGIRDLHIGDIPHLCRALGIGFSQLVAGADPAVLTVMDVPVLRTRAQRRHIR